MNKYLTQLAALDWSKVILIGIALAAGYYFLLFDNGAMIEQNIQQTKEKARVARTQLAETEKAMEDANKFAKDVEETVAAFNKIVQYMPENLANYELQKIVSSNAREVGLQAIFGEPTTEAPKDFTQAVKVPIELRGSYAQVLTFLSRISEERKLIVFQKVEVKPVSNGAQTANAQAAMLVFKAQMIAYRYLKSVADKADAAAATPGAPAAPGAPAPAPGANAAGGT